jgi:hypothetical protein
VCVCVCVCVCETCKERCTLNVYPCVMCVCVCVLLCTCVCVCVYVCVCRIPRDVHACELICRQFLQLSTDTRILVPVPPKNSVHNFVVMCNVWSGTLGFALINDEAQLEFAVHSK